MNLNELTAISPIDGRYRNKVQNLDMYFSEAALIKYRVYVEIEYFIKLVNLPLPQLVNFNKQRFDDIREIHIQFNTSDAQKIKDIESVTNHDVKAVEYFLKEKFDELELSDFKEFIHFGLTSQDINNTAVPASLMDATNHELLPIIENLNQKILDLATEWKEIPMLAKTHGQPASPTKLGKEIYVFHLRLNEQIKMLKEIPFAAKFGGATGNFNAHKVAYPEINWIEFGEDFVNKTLNLKRSYATTQIEHYDYLAAYFDTLSRINTIMIDMSRDFWTYISMNYFKQKIKKGEVGSSAMPHKVNPIDFENAEGNFGIANAISHHLSSKLPISRLQRDLTDSTVLRNIGIPLAHSLIGYNSLIKGLNKLIVSPEVIKADLDENWAVVAEAIQTILRRENYPNPYEALKELTRTNEAITETSIKNFIHNLDIKDIVKDELLKITPFNYTGVEYF